MFVKDQQCLYCRCTEHRVLHVLYGFLLTDVSTGIKPNATTFVIFLLLAVQVNIFKTMTDK